MPIEREEPALAPARSNVLFLFAHQDDEFGVYGFIAREVARGAQVQCAYLTDGGWGNQDIGVRNAESLAVLADLGIAPEAVAFVGQAASIGDGTLHRRLDDAWRSLDALLMNNRFDRIYMPAWEGGHQDHDAAHLIGLRISCSHGLLSGARQYSLYNGFGLVGPLFHVLWPLATNGPVENLRLRMTDRLRYASAAALPLPVEERAWPFPAHGAAARLRRQVPDAASVAGSRAGAPTRGAPAAETHGPVLVSGHGSVPGRDRRLGVRSSRPSRGPPMCRLGMLNRIPSPGRTLPSNLSGSSRARSSRPGNASTGDDKPGRGFEILLHSMLGHRSRWIARDLLSRAR